MTYEPTIWKDGDLVTSAKLNKLEQGVANGGGTLIVNLSTGTPTNAKAIMPPTTFICDKTAGEIYEAFRNGNVRFIFTPSDEYERIMNLIECDKDPEGYYFTTSIFNSFTTLYAATADDYPTTEDSQPVA